MTTSELARAAALHIAQHLAGRTADWRTRDAFVDVAEPVIAGAITRGIRDTQSELLEALRGIIDDGPCRFDHHGNCRAHGPTQPCTMALARAALARATGEVPPC